MITPRRRPSRVPASADAIGRVPRRGARRAASAAHRALADAMPVGSTARAWHLARAAVGPDEEVARALDEAAAITARRGAPSVAGRSWELASRLSPDSRDRVRRLRLAASAVLDAGMAGAAGHLLDRADEIVDARPRGRRPGRADQPPPVALPVAVVERRGAGGRGEPAQGGRRGGSGGAERRRRPADGCPGGIHALRRDGRHGERHRGRGAAAGPSGRRSRPADRRDVRAPCCTRGATRTASGGSTATSR